MSKPPALAKVKAKAKPLKPPRKPTVRPRAKRKTARIDRMTEADRIEIVTRLAMFDTAADIVADLAARGIDISHQGVSRYNPVNNRDAAVKWRDLFQKAREDFLAEMAKEPIAHRAYRLRHLDGILRKELKRGNMVGARATLEQAAKEMGDQFVAAKGGGNGPTLNLFAPGAVTIDEKRNMLLDRLTPLLTMRQHEEGDDGGA
jgi:hypothetical protein